MTTREIRLLLKSDSAYIAVNKVTTSDTSRWTHFLVAHGRGVAISSNLFESLEPNLVEFACFQIDKITTQIKYRFVD